MIYFIHGFLGLPGDWEPVITELKGTIEAPSFQTINLWDYWRGSEDDTSDHFDNWAKYFADQVRRDKSEKKFLVGYSLGGRLALQSLQSKPELWNGAVIISANPGLSTSDLELREKRIVSDLKWVRRFELEEWTRLMKDWNSQSVFSVDSFADSNFSRNEADFDRLHLSRALKDWSLGLQKETDFKNIRCPLLWVTGEKDKKFLQIAEGLKSRVSGKSNIEFEIVENSGHRVLQESPIELASLMSQFFDKN